MTKQVRVIGPEGEQLGVMTLGGAQKSANDRDLDLVLIAPQSEPPVCKIIDYGRFRFERDKRDKEAKKKQQISEIKEIQLSCHIDTNDFNTKANHARCFLTGGDKVRVIVRFRGRQMTHQDIGRKLLTKFAEVCADVGSIDKAPLLEGRSLTMFLAPLKKDAVKADKPAPTEKPEADAKIADDAAQTQSAPEQTPPPAPAANQTARPNQPRVQFRPNTNGQNQNRGNTNGGTSGSTNGEGNS